jgi:hypothetical protein
MAVVFTLDPDERIVAEFRKHWANIVPVFMSTGLLLVVVVALDYVAGRYPDQITKIMPINVFLLIAMGLAVMAGLILILAYVLYRQNRIVLTTLRLEELTQGGLFNRTISRLGLPEIEDVTSRKLGLFPTIFNYGDVLVQTAGEQERFVFRQIGSPDSVARQILEAREACENNRTAPKS